MNEMKYDNAELLGSAEEKATPTAENGGKKWVSLALTAVLLCAVIASAFQFTSYTRKAETPVSLKLSETFENEMNNFRSDLLSDIYYVRKKYKIPEEELVSPIPDPECYGSADDGMLPEIIDRLTKTRLITPSEMVYSEDIETWRDQPARYYADDSIMTVLWREEYETRGGELVVEQEEEKQEQDEKQTGKTGANNKAKPGGKKEKLIVNFAEVFISDGSQIRRKLSGDSYASGRIFRASTLAKSANSVVAMNGDYYQYRPVGLTVYQRTLYRNDVEDLDVCFVDSNGDFIFRSYKRAESDRSIEKFIKDNDIVFSLSFGPTLIENGVPKRLDPDYKLGQPRGMYARAAIAQMGKLHYLLVTIDGGIEDPDGSNKEEGTTVEVLSKIMQGKNCEMAYTLDGGQTATIIFENQTFNRVGYGSERYISDIVYFATGIGVSKSEIEAEGK